MYRCEGSRKINLQLYIFLLVWEINRGTDFCLSFCHLVGTDRFASGISQCCIQLCKENDSSLFNQKCHRFSTSLNEKCLVFWLNDDWLTDRGGHFLVLNDQLEHFRHPGHKLWEKAWPRVCLHCRYTSPADLCQLARAAELKMWCGCLGSGCSLGYGALLEGGSQSLSPNIYMAIFTAPRAWVSWPESAVTV